MKKQMKQIGMLLFAAGFMGIAQAQELELASGQSLARGNGGGNGGFIEDMREASQLGKHFLSAEEIREILLLDGKEIKDELIYPLVRLTKSFSIKDEKVREMWEKMSSADVSLEENVDYTRMEEGTCPHNEDLCTGDVPFSTIYFDVEKIAQNKTTLAELAGMVMHEFSHHYVDYDDHPEYKLANFFKERVASEDLDPDVFFSMEDLLATEGENVYGLLSGRNFCQSKGYRSGQTMEKVLANNLNLLMDKKITRTFLVRATGFNEAPYKNVLRGKEIGPEYNPKIITKMKCHN